MVFEMCFLTLALIQVVGYFVEGCAGFGCAVIAAPFVNSILPPSVGVPYSTTLVVPFLIIQTIRSRKNISWKDWGKVLLAVLPGLFVGQYLFRVMDENVAKIGIGGAVTLIALFKIYQNIISPLVLKKPVVEDAPDTLPKKIFRMTCLIVGGVVHGAFNIGGPLVTVYTLEAVKDKNKFRNTMLCLWMTLDTMNFVNQGISGAWTPYLFSAVLVGYPFAALGFFSGVKFLDKINRTQFLRIVYVILFAVGANMLIRSILAVV